jgi:hypothetical protein
LKNPKRFSIFRIFRGRYFATSENPKTFEKFEKYKNMFKLKFFKL